MSSGVRASWNTKPSFTHCKTLDSNATPPNPTFSTTGAAASKLSHGAAHAVILEPPPCDLNEGILTSASGFHPSLLGGKPTPDAATPRTGNRVEIDIATNTTTANPRCRNRKEPNHHLAISETANTQFSPLPLCTVDSTLILQILISRGAHRKPFQREKSSQERISGIRKSERAFGDGEGEGSWRRDSVMVTLMLSDAV
jgi:hypothetical protein